MKDPIPESVEKLTDEQIEKCRETFDTFDTDGTGNISTAELGNAMRSLGKNVTDVEIGEMLKGLDLDGSGFISFTEFIIIMHGNAAVPQEALVDELREAFVRFDIDEDGLLSESELRAMLRHIMPELSDEELDGMISKLADERDTIFLEFEEFKQMFCP